MAKCFDVVGYIEPCNAVRQKYTGRALLIINNGEAGPVSFTFSENGLKVTAMDAKSSFPEFIGVKLPIIINAENPFGVTVQGNTDSGRAMYTKTIPLSIPATRDGKAEEFIMGMQRGLSLCAIVVLETFGDADENDIFGAYSPIRIDPTSVTRSEYENGGAWQLNLVCDEPVPNVICTMQSLKTALDDLNK